jgi:hypothetical protein
LHLWGEARQLLFHRLVLFISLLLDLPLVFVPDFYEFLVAISTILEVHVAHKALVFNPLDNPLYVLFFEPPNVLREPSPHGFDSPMNLFFVVNLLKDFY